MNAGSVGVSQPASRSGSSCTRAAAMATNYSTGPSANHRGRGRRRSRLATTGSDGTLGGEGGARSETRRSVRLAGTGGTGTGLSESRIVSAEIPVDPTGGRGRRRQAAAAFACLVLPRLPATGVAGGGAEAGRLTSVRPAAGDSAGRRRERFPVQRPGDFGGFGFARRGLLPGRRRRGRRGLEAAPSSVASRSLEFFLDRDAVFPAAA